MEANRTALLSQSAQPLFKDNGGGNKPDMILPLYLLGGALYGIS